MRTIVLVCLLGCVVLAAGYASTISNSAPEETPLGHDAATITFFRLTGPPAALKGTLSIDGREVGTVFVRRFAILRVNPGKHELRFSFPRWAGAPDQYASVECRPKEHCFICYDSSMSLAAIVPVGPMVVFRMSSGLRLVSKEDAAPYLDRFDLAFRYGYEEPNQSLSAGSLEIAAAAAQLGATTGGAPPFEAIGTQVGTLPLASKMESDRVQDIISRVLSAREWEIVEKANDHVVGHIKRRGSEALLTLVFNSKLIRIYCEGWKVDKKTGSRIKPQLPESWIENIRKDLAARLGQAAAMD